MTRSRTMHHITTSQPSGSAVRGLVLCGRDRPVVLAKQYDYPVAQGAQTLCHPVAEGTA